MNLHMAAVERHMARHVRLPGDGSEQLLPNAPFAPTCKPVVDRLRRSVFPRAILPPTAAALDMHDAAQYAPIVIALRPRLVGGQMRFDPRPLLVAEPKQARIHGLAPESLTNPLNQRIVN
jgi:hypothetical protein